MVSTSSLICMAILIALSFLLPIVLAVVFYKKEKISFKAVGIGAAIFVIFALILEQVCHFVFLKANKNVGSFIMNTPWLYGIYGGLAAGIFEEVGRFVGYKYMLKGQRRWKDGIAYGIGHGGIEAILIGGMAGINSIVNSMLINSGKYDAIIKAAPSSSVKALNAAKESLISANPSMFLVSGYERCCAVLLQIGLSLLVLYAVKNRKSIYLFLAIFLHAFVDFFAVLTQKGIIGIAFIEIMVGVAAVISLVFIIKSRKTFDENLPASESGVQM